MSVRPSSARFLLRLPAPLHRVLRRAAAQAGLSLNEWCVRRLAAGGTGLSTHEAASAVLARAAAVAGQSLAGVVVYGSWIRGTAGPGSDVDVLVVLDADLPLTRALYRDWDTTPVTWEGRPVDPHFVQLPASGHTSGVWGEAALDGVVLFETGLRVSAVLAQTRHDIVEGRLVRREIHGQPYWVAA
jgi:Nucleotidyltransferase domain/HicB family